MNFTLHTLNGIKLWLVLLLLSGAINVCRADSPRQTINFNRGWKYCQGDFDHAARPGFDDSEWEKIGLPHSFSTPYFMSKDFYVGYGWYRKAFPVKKEILGKKSFLEFDGVFQEAEIFVNGHLAGTHKGGYTGFSIDISAYLKEGKNLVAVRVNNCWRPDLAPRAGEHVFSGGIYRNVRLVIKPPTYIDWYGTWVTTPDLAENKGKSGSVHIRTDVCNASGKTDTYRLLTTVVDAQGKEVSSVSTSQVLPDNATYTFEQQTKEIQAPQLWHPNHPALYKVISSLYHGQELIDRYETAFGFRWFEWTADRGFFLNGEHLYFKGANVHQDHAGWGDAVTETGMRRDIRLVKEAGFDLIRGSHYPHSPAFSQACDEIGMLFWAENAFWGIGGHKGDGYWNASAYPVNESDRAEFENSVKAQLKELIHIHRNHPSIIVWSMSNEPFFTAPETIDPMRKLLEETVKLSKQLDPTRPAAVGGAQRPLGEKRIDKLGDIAGYNGDGSYIPEFQQPGMPTVVSEYGSTTADRPGEYDPGWGDLAKNNAQNGFPWRSGQAIWCAFDHGSIAGSALGKMGIIDYFRIPKRAWYWYRNAYKGITPPEWPQEGTPARISLVADRTDNIKADGTDDVMLSITILNASGKPVSNSPAVKLDILSGPGEFPTGTSILFEKESDIRILDGKAAIEFRSYYAGETVIRATSPGLEPAEVKIRFTGSTPYTEAFKVKERPYTRFETPTKTDNLQTFGPNNPTFCSSSANGHSSAFAADGDESTYWQASENDPERSWTLDTEKGLSIRHIRIAFPDLAPYQYKVEVSMDREHWSLIPDQTNNKQNENIRMIQVVPGIQGRFVRISFTGEKAAITDVQVIGTVID